MLLTFFFFAKEISAQLQPFDSNTVKIDTSKFEMKKSPWEAVLRSAILPGFGQFYNESYWKIPIVWGTLGYLGYLWNTNNNFYLRYRDLYSQSLLENKDGFKTYLDGREFYKDQRDLVAVFIGLTYLLNLIDAYVDAHLFDFDVTGNSYIGNMQFSVKINF
ncbi:MAG: DUF5683 domain-containing protein [Bacteroidota bacterium]